MIDDIYSIRDSMALNLNYEKTEVTLSAIFKALTDHFNVYSYTTFN